MDYINNTYTNLNTIYEILTISNILYNNTNREVLPLEEFISECKGYAESINGYYTVTENGENQYKIEFGTSDDSFADEPGTDPYYEESCGVVVVELIYPFDEEMADYIENGGY